MRFAPPLALLICLAVALPAAAAPRLTPIGSHAFDGPVYVTAPPEDPRRLFVIEKPGRVWAIVDGGPPQLFLDISDEVDEQGEEGLASIAFAPDYATSRRFYAFFTAADPDMGIGSMIKVVEFTRPLGTLDSAAGATRRTVLEIPHPRSTNHNGGQLQFGPDGMLWIAVGDGDDNWTDAQDTENSLLGKLLRIDVRPNPAGPYLIPEDNPFASGGGRPEIWAYGLRNPWRFSFDRQTGDLSIADVGGSFREELNFAPSGTGAGANYGWPCREGSTDGPIGCVAPKHVPPVYDYPHSTSGCSGIMGGYVVRDPGLPTLAGRYLFTDLCWSAPRSLLLGQPAATDEREEPALPFARIVSFGEDSCGHVYVVSILGTLARVDDEPFTPCPEPGGSRQPPGGGTAKPPVGDGSPAPDATGPAPDTTPPAPDTTPPALVLSRARRQHLIARRLVRFAARCDETCGLTTQAKARLSIRGKTRRWSFATISRLAPASERQVLELRLTSAMSKAVARRVRAGARPLIRVVVIARDSAGNESRATVYVRVVG